MHLNGFFVKTLQCDVTGEDGDQLYTKDFQFEV